MARLGGNFSARASASYHDARFRDFVTDFGGVATQLRGKRLEMSPRYLLGGGLSYAPARGIFGMVRANWVGNRFLNKRNTALAPGYATWAARFGWRAERWEVAVAGENLSNRRDPVAESELGDAQYYRLTARRVDLSAAYRF